MIKIWFFLIKFDTSYIRSIGARRWHIQLEQSREQGREQGNQYSRKSGFFSCCLQFHVNSSQLVNVFVMWVVYMQNMFFVCNFIYLPSFGLKCQHSAIYTAFALICTCTLISARASYCLHSSIPCSARAVTLVQSCAHMNFTVRYQVEEKKEHKKDSSSAASSDSAASYISRIDDLIFSVNICLVTWCSLNIACVADNSMPAAGLKYTSLIVVHVCRRPQGATLA